jgi:hypothetical protein
LIPFSYHIRSKPAEIRSSLGNSSHYKNVPSQLHKILNLLLSWVPSTLSFNSCSKMFICFVELRKAASLLTN